jgi:hypothetical protein
LGTRGRALARQGNVAEASATADKLAALMPVDSENLFQAAEVHALCAGHEESGSSSGKSSTGEETAESQSAARALELLQQADAAGYFKSPEKLAKLSADRNLDAIRSLDDFKKLAAEIPPVTADKRPPLFTKWTYAADERGDPGSFEMEESDWVELKKGKVYARFTITEATTDYVELYDKSRKLWVRLGQTSESYSTDQKNWHRLFAGAPVREQTSPADFSRSPPPALDSPKSD